MNASVFAITLSAFVFEVAAGAGAITEHAGLPRTNGIIETGRAPWIDACERQHLSAVFSQDGRFMGCSDGNVVHDATNPMPGVREMVRECRRQHGFENVSPFGYWAGCSR